MVLVGLAIVAGISSCSTADPPVDASVEPTTSVTSTPVGAALVPTATQTAWVDSLCAVGRALVKVSQLPLKAGAGWVDASAAHRGEIVAFLTEIDNTLTSLRQQVNSLPPAPFTNGDAVVKAYRDTIDPLQAKIAEYASKAATFPPDGVAAVFRLASVELVTFSVNAPSLKDDPVYVRARKLAPNCDGQ